MVMALLKIHQSIMIINATRSSEVGAGSNPAAALALVAILSLLRFGEDQLRRCIMSERMKKTKSKSGEAKRCMSKLMLIVTHIFGTVWATGVSVAAAMAISTPIYLGRVREYPAHFSLDIHRG